jgi:hypothetical protein
MVLIHLHKPRNDSSFPDELKGLPIFQGKVKLKKDQTLQPTSMANHPSNPQIPEGQP